MQILGIQSIYTMWLIKELVLVVISPTKLAFILFIAGLIAVRAGKRKAANFFYITAALWLLVFSQPYIADLLIYPLEHTQIKKIDAQRFYGQTPYVLPLACYYQTTGVLPEVSRWPECSLQRMLMAQELAEQYDGKIVLTGGNFLKQQTVNYSQKASEFLRSRHFPTNRTIIVGVGSSTYQELASIVDIVQNTHVIIVTSATHNYRAQAMADQLGINAQIVSVNFHSSGELSPYLTLPSAHALQKTQHALYEYFAILKHIIENQ